MSGTTALARASENGYTEIVQALLAAPGIDVNHANVSIYPLTPSQSHVVVRSEGGGDLRLFIPLFALSLTLTLVILTYHPLTSKMYPITRGKKLKWYLYVLLIVYFYCYWIITLFSS